MDKLIFDIGATNTKFALMNTNGDILAREKVQTIYDTPEAFFNNIMSIFTKYKGLGDQIAISTNGRMYPDGNTYRAYINKNLQGINLRKEMEARTGLPVKVINDGFSATLGEWWKGSGQNCNNMMSIVLGSGTGGGLILDRKLYQGSKLNAAMVFGMLSACSGDKYEISGFLTAFTLLLYELSVIKQIPIQEMTGEKFFNFITQGDPAATKMLDTYCESLATIIFNSAMLLDLDCIVVTGGLSEQDILIETINRKLNEIPLKALAGQASSLFNMACGDPEDFNVNVKKGALFLDANIYGALYYLLHDK